LIEKPSSQQHREGADDRHRHREQRDDRSAPGLQEQHDHDHDQQDASNSVVTTESIDWRTNTVGS
jgi:hypothetical protein